MSTCKLRFHCASLFFYQSVSAVCLPPRSSAPYGLVTFMYFVKSYLNGISFFLLFLLDLLIFNATSCVHVCIQISWYPAVAAVDPAEVGQQMSVSIQTRWPPSAICGVAVAVWTRNAAGAQSKCTRFCQSKMKHKALFCVFLFLLFCRQASGNLGKKFVRKNDERTQEENYFPWRQREENKIWIKVSQGSNFTVTAGSIIRVQFMTKWTCVRGKTEEVCGPGITHVVGT